MLRFSCAVILLCFCEHRDGGVQRVREERRPSPADQVAYREWNPWELAVDCEPQRQVRLTADGV